MKFNFQTTYLDLPPLFFTENQPEKCPAPNLLCFNQELAQELGLGFFQSTDLNDHCRMLLSEGSRSFSQAYAGHQFGHFNMLGDGRAHILGEHVTSIGRRFDIQLKGSGRTPYSRNGDGKAAIAPMLREYLISEAMYHLGIPTTRSLAVVGTGDFVQREKVLPGALLVRVAASHIRVGTFQFAAALGDVNMLRKFADYVISRHDPEVAQNEKPYLDFFSNVVDRQARLVAQWMNIGFIHGVMNTDNMLISGETIDYGPCAFINEYDLGTVFSSIDRQGRYAFGKQPEITYWNLLRLAETLLPLLNENKEVAIELAKEALKKFEETFQYQWQQGLRKKLGLMNEELNDVYLINQFLKNLQQHKPDFTNTFCDLIHVLKGGCLHSDSPFIKHESFKFWLSAWQQRVMQEVFSPLELMQKSNPAIIPRNHLVEEALAAASDHGDLVPFNKLLKVLSLPYIHTGVEFKYQQPPGSEFAGYKTFCGT